VDLDVGGSASGLEATNKLQSAKWIAHSIKILPLDVKRLPAGRQAGKS
jgi:hypothetical protein